MLGTGLGLVTLVIVDNTARKQWSPLNRFTTALFVVVKL